MKIVAAAFMMGLLLALALAFALEAFNTASIGSSILLGIGCFCTLYSLREFAAYCLNNKDEEQ